MTSKQKSTEPDKPTEENLVQDLKESLKNTIDETKYILDDLEQTVETTIKDQSISDETKKIVDSISDEINNFEEE
jgi:conjugal transfer/entry exclusion protein